MSDCICRIEKLANGYTVAVLDPSVQATNKKPKSVWKDPWKEYAFKTPKEVTMFVTKVLPTLAPEAEDMGKLFQEACAIAGE